MIALLKLVIYKDNVRVDILTTGVGNAPPTSATRQLPAGARTTTKSAPPFRTAGVWRFPPGNKLTSAVNVSCDYYDRRRISQSISLIATLRPERRIANDLQLK